MRIVFDSHAHLYPEFDPRAALEMAAANLLRAGPGSELCALCLTQTQRGPSLSEIARSFPAATLRDGGMSLIVSEFSVPLAVFDGQQLLSSEGIEVLALLPGTRLTWERLPLAELVPAVRRAGGLPVLPWSPGKWLGKRGALVAALLQSASDQVLFPGDIAMRPRGFPLPKIAASAANRGKALLCGSDPLPYADEQARLGRYAMCYDGPDLSGSPREKLLRVLLHTPEALRACGERLSAASAAWSLGRHMFLKKLSRACAQDAE